MTAENFNNNNNKISNNNISPTSNKHQQQHRQLTKTSKFRTATTFTWFQDLFGSRRRFRHGMYLVIFILLYSYLCGIRHAMKRIGNATTSTTTNDSHYDNDIDYFVNMWTNFIGSSEGGKGGGGGLFFWTDDDNYYHQGDGVEDGDDGYNDNNNNNNEVMTDDDGVGNNNDNSNDDDTNDNDNNSNNNNNNNDDDKIIAKNSNSTHTNARNEENENDEDSYDPRIPRFVAPKELKLPKPIINVGFPKAGTSTIFQFFHCNGLKSQHWLCCEEQDNPGGTNTSILMSRCIMENIVIANQIRQQQQEQKMNASSSSYSNSLLPTPPKLFDDCGNFDVYTEINGPRNFKDYNYKVLWDDGTLLPKRPQLILPQHHYLEEIHEAFPNATFILNQRPVLDWVESVLHWPTQLRNEIPLEFFFQRQVHPNKFGWNQTVSTATTNANSSSTAWKDPKFIVSHVPQYLEFFYNFHNDYVREFVKNHPSHALIEVDITKNETGTILAETFGLQASCWGHANKNKRKGKKGEKGKNGRGRGSFLGRSEQFFKRFGHGSGAGGPGGNGSRFRRAIMNHRNGWNENNEEGDNNNDNGNGSNNNGALNDARSRFEEFQNRLGERKRMELLNARKQHLQSQQQSNFFGSFRGGRRGGNINLNMNMGFKDVVDFDNNNDNNVDLSSDMTREILTSGKTWKQLQLEKLILKKQQLGQTEAIQNSFASKFSNSINLNDANDANTNHLSTPQLERMQRAKQIREENELREQQRRQVRQQQGQGERQKKPFGSFSFFQQNDKKS